MSLAVETIETQQGAQLMASPEIQYVSLVQYAANREPFRVVKNDQTGGGNNMGGSVIQRIIAPVGTDLVAVLKEEGIDFAGNVSVEVKSEHEGYDIYTQMGVEKFDTSIPFQLKRMSDNSESQVMAVYGVLKSEEVNSETETKSDLESPLNTTVVSMDVEQGYYGMYVTTTSAMDSLDNELYNLMRGVYSVAQAAGLDGKTRLKTMLALVDGFRNFLSTLMAFVNDSTDSSTKSENQEADSSDILHLSKFEKLNAMISAVNEVVNKSEVIEMSLKPEDIEAITKSVAEVMATATKSEADSAVTEITTKMEAIVAETEAIKKEKEDLVAKSESLSAEIETLKAEKAELEKKISDMEALPAETPAVKSEFSGFVTVTGAKKADGFAVFDSLFAGK